MDAETALEHESSDSSADHPSVPANRKESKKVSVADDSYCGESDIHSLCTHKDSLSPFRPSISNLDKKVSGSETCSQLDFDLDVHLSLCLERKVSVVVSVNYDSKERNVKASSRLCVFPLLKAEGRRMSHGGSVADLSAATPIDEGTTSRELVVVNPTAFGKHIPETVTIETARQVARTANISSEDWAKKYRFSQVIWPGETAFTALHSMSRAVVNDIMDITKDVISGSGCTRTFCAVGNESKTSTLFGTASQASATPALKETPGMSSTDILQQYGLVGLTYQRLLEMISGSSSAVCTISMLEIAEEDVLHDLLAPRPFDPDPGKRLRIRYGGGGSAHAHAGAFIEGLTDISLDSLHDLRHALHRAFTAALNPSRKHRRGHIVATVRVWQQNCQQPQTKCFTTVQFVDLANIFNGDGSASEARRNNSVRKSISALGSVLRGLSLKEAGHAAATFSYRESSLTKVMQRSLDHPAARVVLLSCISPFSQTYDKTMATLRYASTILHSAVYMASKSPFDEKKESRTSSPISMDPFSGVNQDAVLLQKLLSDPRQRLAKVLKHSNHKTGVRPFDSSTETYIPTEYMEFDPALVGMEQNENKEVVLEHDDEFSFEQEQWDVTEIGNHRTIASTFSQDTMSNDGEDSENREEDDSVKSFEDSETSPLASPLTSPLTACTDECFSQAAILTAPDLISALRSPELDDETHLEAGEKDDKYAIVQNGSRGSISKGNGPNDEHHSDERGSILTQQTKNSLVDLEGEGVQSVPSKSSSKTKQKLADALSKLGLVDSMNGDFSSGEKVARRSRTDDNKTASTAMTSKSDATGVDENTDSKPYSREEMESNIGDFNKNAFNPRSASTQLSDRMADLFSKEDYVKPMEKQDETADGGILKKSNYLETAAVVDREREINSNDLELNELHQFRRSHNEIVANLLSDRDKFEKEAERARQELRHQTAKHRYELDQREKEIITLRKNMANIGGDRSEVVKIAEEAIATQAKLEKKVESMETELSFQVSRSVSIEKFQSLERALASRSLELDRLRKQNGQYKLELEQKLDALARLKESLEDLKMEISHMTKERESHEKIMELIESALRQNSAGEQSATIEECLSELILDKQAVESAKKHMESDLTGQLKEQNNKYKKLKDDLEFLKIRNTELQEDNSRASECLQSEVDRLESLVSNLRKERDLSQAAQTEAEKLVSIEARAKEHLAKELEQTRMDLDCRISDVENLSEGVKNLLASKAKDKAEISSLQEGFEFYQQETRSKVMKVAKRQEEASSLIEQTQQEKLKLDQELADTRRDLNEALEVLQREREYLRIQRQRENTISEREPYQHERENDYKQFRPSDEVNDTARRPQSEENYAASTKIDSRLLDRTEEVAASVAISAKSSMERNKRENLRLEQQLYAISDAKDAEIRALKARLQAYEMNSDVYQRIHRDWDQESHRNHTGGC